MKFRSAYESHDRVFSPTGNGYEKKYKREYQPDIKRYQLVCSGETDVYKLIQVSAEGIDLKSLLARYINGDESALGTDPGSYADLTVAPKTLLEAHLKLRDAKTTFDALSADVKKEFNNNFDEFISSVGNGDFSKMLGQKVKDLKTVEAPVFTDKQKVFIEEMISNAKS